MGKTIKICHNCNKELTHYKDWRAINEKGIVVLCLYCRNGIFDNYEIEGEQNGKESNKNWVTSRK